MNRFDYSNLGGQPIDLDHLNKIQDAYREGFRAMALMLGNKVIMSGCDVTGTVVSDGYITYNGEPLYFAGGTITPTSEVVIVETPTSVVFDDTTTHDVEFVRYAAIAVSGLFPFADLKRPPIYTTGDIKEKIVSSQYITDNFDSGSGIGKNAEAGWGILSIVNPDTAGKLFVNYDPADVLFDTIGNNGGSKNATLTPENLPQLSSGLHGLINRNGFNTFTSGDTSGGEYDLKNPVVWPGQSQPFSLMPPYYVILKLIRL
jgi:hypothetical protein